MGVREHANRLLEAMSANASVAPTTTDEVFPLPKTLCDNYVDLSSPFNAPFFDRVSGTGGRILSA